MKLYFPLPLLLIIVTKREFGGGVSLFQWVVGGLREQVFAPVSVRKQPTTIGSCDMPYNCQRNLGKVEIFQTCRSLSWNFLRIESFPQEK